MIHVELENIFSETEASSRAGQLFRKVYTERELVVVMIDGKPGVGIIDVGHLEELTGRSVTPVAPLAKPYDAAPGAVVDTATQPSPPEPVRSLLEPETDLSPSLPPPPAFDSPYGAPQSPVSSPLGEPLPQEESSLNPFSVSPQELPDIPAAPSAPVSPVPATAVGGIPQAPAPAAPPVQPSPQLPPLPQLNLRPSAPALPAEDLNNSSPLG